MPTAVHVVGAGLSGLAAAVALAGRGHRVAVYEAAGQAGGRCRSLFDDRLEREIDNGNHLVLSGNSAIAAYLQRIGAADRLTGPERAVLPFLDLASGERWELRPGNGPWPWWILSSRRRIPGTRIRDYLATWRLAVAGPDATVAGCFASLGPLYRRFWEPLAIAVLNTEPEAAQASLLWPVLVETFGRGEAACRPRIARRGLGDCFVGPALDYLRRQGATVRFHARLREFDFCRDRVRRLRFGDIDVDLSENDGVVLAVPPWAAAQLLPGLTVPMASRAIVNAHFRLPAPLGGPDLLGLVGGTAQWVFVRGDVASVTVSAANGLAEGDNERIAMRLWPEISRALGVTAALPRWRVIKEKRATFAQTPAEVARRPHCRTAIRNLVLAGDWTATGLPATLEGSVRSGNTAADSVFASATIS